MATFLENKAYLQMKTIDNVTDKCCFLNSISYSENKCQEDKIDFSP